MDPKACLERLLCALHQSDNVESIAAAADLLGWLLAGGAVPACTVAERQIICLGLAQIADAAEAWIESC